MKNYLRFAFGLALLCATLSLASSASSLYIVQGLAGRNHAAATDPAFPVDVLLNDEVCYVHGIPFGTVQGPLTFLPGSYNIKVSIANTLAPCSNSPLIDRTITIDATTDYSAVIALNAAGTPVLRTFTNNLSPVAANFSRLLFAQAANSPAVQVILQNSTTKKSYTYTVNPGGLLDVNLPAGYYTIEINEGATTLTSSPIVLDSQAATLLYAIGEASNNTVVLASRVLRDVI
jgi:hypothetical protein